MAKQIVTIEVSFPADGWEEENEIKTPADVDYESAIDRWLSRNGNPRITHRVQVLSASPIRYNLDEGPDAVKQ